MEHDVNAVNETIPSRRHDKERQILEQALISFVERYQLPPGSVERLSNELYRLWRDHHGEKRRAAADQRYYDDFRSSARTHFERKLKENDKDTLLNAARTQRYRTLRNRKLSRPKAIAAALEVEYLDLSRREMLAARDQILSTTITGRKDRKASLEVRFLERAAEMLERETGHPIRFSSHTESRPPSEQAPGRHYGKEFDVMAAAAKVAGLTLTNEALAVVMRRIRTSRRKSC